MINNNESKKSFLINLKPSHKKTKEVEKYRRDKFNINCI